MQALRPDRRTDRNGLRACLIRVPAPAKCGLGQRATFVPRTLESLRLFCFQDSN